MDSGTTTGVETTASTPTNRRTEQSDVPPANGSASRSSNAITGGRETSVKKYRHVVAVHSKVRPSTLSHDSEVTPSFVGFRNLMVILLGMMISDTG
jgi:diacylglycerol O-acyltransferase 1